MSSFVSKVTNMLPKQNNKFDLSCSNVTSNDFFQFKVVYNREMVPGSSINVKASMFTRLSPLTKPYYGQCQVINRAFFVPYRTVFQSWNSFITQTKNELIGGVDYSVPVIRNNMFREVLSTPSNNFAQTITVTSNDPYSSSYDGGAFDFAVRSSDTTYTTYRFTRLGQQVYDVLLNLGYRVDFLSYNTAARNVRFSALPLFCLIKIYFDWYRNSQFENDDYLPRLSSSEEELTQDQVLSLLQKIKSIPYERDYFTSSWLNPSGPNSNSPIVTLPDVSLPLGSPTSKSAIFTSDLNASSPQSGTPTIRRSDNSSSVVNNFTQYLDTALHKATDYIKRWQLFGSRTADIMKALYGVDLSDVALNRSVHIGKSVDYIDVADVMQTSPTDDSVLGNYAGKGIGVVNGTFNYKTDEFGQFMIISVIVPKIMYTQGRDRHLFHLEAEQFFQKDFDRLGVQAIRNDELYVPSEYGGDSSYLPTKVFGFTSRYAEYKTAVNDRRSGLFALRSLNGDNRWNCFHFTRFVQDWYKSVSGIQNSLNFCKGEPEQYDRIFADNDNTCDHFISIYNFNVEMWQPMSKLFDDYEWSECDGLKQTLPLGGTQVQ